MVLCDKMGVYYYVICCLCLKKKRYVKKNNLNTFNDFKGKADMCGKQYLLDLTLEDYPVIPTVDSIDNLDLLPIVDSYVIKPKDGADSLGLKENKEPCEP